jgi:hypothetical protein
MKKSLFVFVIGFIFSTATYAQVFNNFVNYSLNGTPVNGIKITTNLPFTTSSQMPTIVIHGYNYGGTNYGGVGAIDLTLTYYIYGTAPAFVHFSVSSSGAYNPPVSLSNENGKVVIFLDDKPYFPRFTVSAFASGMTQDISANYAGWTVADAALTGVNTVLVPYVNTFSGDVTMPGTGIWSSTGNVGIGTTNTQGYKLAINGGAIATAMTVKLYGNWPDYVFKKAYNLPSLTDVKTYIEQNHHLPEMPSETEVAANGINLGELNKLLLKKVEELTLYLINKEEINDNQQRQIKSLENQVSLINRNLNLRKPSVLPKE